MQAQQTIAHAMSGHRTSAARQNGDVAKPSEETAVVRAINSLHFKRHVNVNGVAVELVLLVHPEGRRPLQAEWWTGKEASIIGADVFGNFLLRLSDGSVGYWDHREAKVSAVAPSIRAFIESIE